MGLNIVVGIAAGDEDDVIREHLAVISRLLDRAGAGPWAEPELDEQDLEPGGSGVRAQALDKSGRLLDDFYFAYRDRILHVGNVPSPAATASLVIGREIVSRLLENADLGRVQVAVGRFVNGDAIQRQN